MLKRWLGTPENTIPQTHPVGLLKTNGFGLYDMSNVGEWFGIGMEHTPSFHKPTPSDIPSGSKRVVRGGSCFNEIRIQEYQIDVIMNLKSIQVQ